MTTARTLAAAGTAAVLTLTLTLTGLAGCTKTGGAPDAAPDAVAVTADDTTCTVAATELPAGTHAFRVANSGAKITEFYVYGPDGRIVGEVENIAPGLSRDLRVSLAAGVYQAVCKPGMTGAGIRQALTVAGATSTTAPADPLLVAATATYERYVRAQSAELLRRTRAWTAVVTSGDAAAARAGFADTRAPYERIEPVAESFAELDARIDARDTDLDPAAAWTGFHKLEKDLWQGGLPASPVVAGLLADVTALHRRLSTQAYTALEIANGAKSLLDEVASKKVTGEEDHFSHTDLSDFAANVDGSKAATDALRPAVDRRDPAMGKAIDERFAAVTALLSRYRKPDGSNCQYLWMGFGLLVAEYGDQVLVEQVVQCHRLVAVWA